tara:strand:- start:759 stop:1757 length:999 start_codon:yes stop_codon:yes gene_type:complete
MYDSYQSTASSGLTLGEIVLYLSIAVLALIWLATCFFVVQPRQGRMVQFFGGKVVNAKVTTGIGVKAPWPIHTVTSNISLAEFSISEELQSVRTEDDSIVGMKITAFLVRDANDFENSVFSLLDYKSQIKSIISEATKEIVPDLTVNDLFKDRDKVQNHVCKSLNDYFNKYGFIFNKVVVDDPVLDEETRDSMNAVKRAELDLIAARKNREAIREREVGAAEAAAESLLKRSEASVKVRKDNGSSLAETIKAFKESLPDVPVSYLMETLQGIDERDAIVSASNNKGSVVVVSTGRGNNGDAAGIDMGQMMGIVDKRIDEKMKSAPDKELSES